jgi:hypothetical protein
VSKALLVNTFYAVILEFKGSAVLQNTLSSGLGSSSVSWSTASSSASAGASIGATNNNGIGIGGVNNGSQFYSSNTSALVTVSNTTSNTNLLQGGRVYEIILMNNTITSTGGTTLSNFKNYLANKYVR